MSGAYKSLELSMEGQIPFINFFPMRPANSGITRVHQPFKFRFLVHLTDWAAMDSQKLLNVFTLGSLPLNKSPSLSRKNQCLLLVSG